MNDVGKNIASRTCWRAHCLVEFLIALAGVVGVALSADENVPDDGRWIIVNLADRRISVCEEGRLIRQVAHFSVGRPGHPTPLVSDALILPDKRYRMHRSSFYPRPHGGAPMPYSLFFTETAAFHAGSVHAQSHGCVHLNDADAQWLFNWVGNNTVHVRFIGPYSHQHSAVGPARKSKIA